MKVFWSRFLFLFLVSLFLTSMVFVKFAQNVGDAYLSNKSLIYHDYLKGIIYVDKNKMSFSTMKNLQHIAVQLMQKDPEFVEMFVYREDGHIIYATQLGLVGDLVPQDWFSQMALKQSDAMFERDHYYSYYQKSDDDQGYWIAINLNHLEDPLRLKTIQRYGLALFSLFLGIFIISAICHALILKKFTKFTRDQIDFLSEEKKKKEPAIEPIFDKFKDKAQMTQKDISGQQEELENYEDFQ